MKSKLFIPGLLISIALVTFSCTTDDYDVPATQGVNLKTITKEELKKEVNTTVIDSITISTPNDDGEPNNPKPPRT
ncbi:hypothetical protein [Flavobacterium aquidurense]|uniref:Lipoprotein n=1 Tax=Flavobacterium aquidurense TaxID=362413 RepID=A0A0Q0WAJ3_9FLAO|nr:hypothetical protein [Flavobacterium aquidurense]KQB41368.1 hypothetical protein RC62_4114 [Flavobacterium aquidurense]